MEDTIEMLEISCPVCGGHIFKKELAEKSNIYCCEAQKDEEHKCWAKLIYCKKCGKYYPEEGFGKHGDVYECKECGSVHWGYTEWKRETDETHAFLFSQLGRMDALQDIIRNL